MLFLELLNKKQIDAAPNTMLQAEISNESRKRRQTQGQVGMLQQDVEASQQNLAAVTDTTRKIDPKLTQLRVGLDTAASDLGSRVATVKDALRQTTAKIASLEIKGDQATSGLVSVASDLDQAKRQTAVRLAVVEGKADQALTDTSGVSSELTKTKQQLQSQVGQLGQTIDETTSMVQAIQGDVRRHNGQIQGHLALHDDSILRFSEALSGNIKLYAEAIAADLSAAELNAAAAGTFTRDLTISLVSEMGEGESAVRYVHPWALLPVVITAEASADPDIDPPEVKDHDDPLAVPQFKSGVLSLVVTLDTDAGVTKTYVAEDEVSVTVKVSATVGASPNTSKLLGWDVADFTMTYNVIA